MLGEHHYDTTAERAPDPDWLVIPERGLYTGLMIVGAVGTGKTSACMHPYVHQLLAYHAHDPAQRLGGLLLEVKGDFCAQVQEMLRRHGREADYLELSLDGPWSYNPLASDLDPYALAYGIASVLTNLYGRSDEPFWMQAYTNLLRFTISLFKVLDGYVTLFDVYCACINPELIRNRVAEGAARFTKTAETHLRVAATDYFAHLADHPSTWHAGDQPEVYEAARSDDLVEYLEIHRVAYETIEPARDEITRAEQFQAVQRWFEHDWSRIENKLRTSIVEGISVFLSLFDDPVVKATFCPPRESADSTRRPLPPIADLIDEGRFLALNLPVAMNPGLARAIGVALKQDFQRAVLNRIPRISSQPERHWRPVLFVVDEYQTFATTGENDPSGDEKFFSLSRQGKCIAIVATQSFSSLQSTLAGKTWLTLVQAFRTWVVLTLSDNFSARVASERSGNIERWKRSYTVSEAGHRSAVNLLTGRSAAQNATVSAAKSYQRRFEPAFQSRAFMQLRNAQAVVFGYDGFNPWPPTYCWLKPHFLDVQTSYFDHLAAGRL